MLLNAANCLIVLKLFSIELGKKEFKKVTREDVLEFLDKRKKSIDVDPEKKWVENGMIIARLVGFYR